MLAITAEPTPIKFLQNQQVRAKLKEITISILTNGKPPATYVPQSYTREGRHTEIQSQPGVIGGNPFPSIQGVLHFLIPRSV